MALTAAYKPAHWTAKGLGWDSTYQNVVAVMHQPIGKKVEIVFAIWADEATRRTEGAEPIDTRAIAIVNTPASTDGEGVEHPASNDYDEFFSPKALSAEGVDPIAQCYEAAKRHPLFKDAKDC